MLSVYLFTNSISLLFRFFLSLSFILWFELESVILVCFFWFEIPANFHCLFIQFLNMRVRIGWRFVVPGNLQSASLHTKRNLFVLVSHCALSFWQTLSIVLWVFFSSLFKYTFSKPTKCNSHLFGSKNSTLWTRQIKMFAD